MIAQMEMIPRISLRRKWLAHVGSMANIAGYRCGASQAGNNFWPLLYR